MRSKKAKKYFNLFNKKLGRIKKKLEGGKFKCETIRYLREDFILKPDLSEDNIRYYIITLVKFLKYV